MNMKRIIIAFLAIGLVSLGAGAQGSARLKPQIAYSELSALLSRPDSKILLLDVRTKEEFQSGHIAGAILFPYDQLESSFREKDKDRPIVVYCRSGRRSAIAKASLEGMGYSQVSDFGGIGSWKGKLVSGD
jgi:phage shock protein E